MALANEILRFTPWVEGTAPAPPAPSGCDDVLLEVWPPPDQPYLLRIRGYPNARVFGAADADGNYDDTQVTQCDARAVFLMALANAKAHYGKADANVAANELTSLIQRLRAARHGNYRYIPGHWPHRVYIEPKWEK